MVTVVRDLRNKDYEGECVITNIKFSFAKRDGEVGEIVGFCMVTLSNALTLHRVVVEKGEGDTYLVKMPYRKIKDKETGFAEFKDTISFVDSDVKRDFDQVIIDEFLSLLDRYENEFSYNN